MGNEMKTYHITEQFNESVWDEMVRISLPYESYCGFYQEIVEYVPLDYMWKQYFNKVGSKTVYFDEDGTLDSRDVFRVVLHLQNKLKRSKEKRFNEFRQIEIAYMKAIPNFEKNATDAFYRFSFCVAYKKEYGEEEFWKMIIPEYKPFNFMDWIENG